MLIEYTSHEAVKANTLAALERGVGVVVGSSGLTAADFDEIDAAARERGTGVIAAGNFSLTAAMAQAAALLAARHLPHWEVIDYASAAKADVPSGTARELAERLAAVRAPAAARADGRPARPRRAARRSRAPRSTRCGCPASSSRPRSSSACPTSASRSATTPAAPRRRTSPARCWRPARWPAGPASRAGSTRCCSTSATGTVRLAARSLMTELATQVPLATVADRLRGARRRCFVGRAAELELFRAALEAPEPPFSVLWIYGPGGVGKTTLLGALADAAERPGATRWRSTCAGIEPSPPAFTAELARAAAVRIVPVCCCSTRSRRQPRSRTCCASSSSPAFRPARSSWSRAARARATHGAPTRAGASCCASCRCATSIPRTRGRCCAGPASPASCTSGCSGSRTATRSRSRCCSTCSRRQRASAAARARRGARCGRPAPRELRRRRAERAPPARARARRAARVSTTAALLRDALATTTRTRCSPGCAGCRSWRRAHGLFPHDLARDVIDADLRWRDPAAHVRVHGRVRADVVARVRATAGREHAAGGGRPDLPAPRQPGGARILGLGEPGRGATRTRCGAGRRGRDPRDGRAPRGSGVGRDRRALAEAPAGRLRRASAGAAPEPVGFLAQLALHSASRGGARARSRRARVRGWMRERHGTRGPARRCSPALLHGPRRLPGAVAVVQRGHDALDAGVAGPPAAGVVLIACADRTRGAADGATSASSARRTPTSRSAAAAMESSRATGAAVAPGVARRDGGARARRRAAAPRRREPAPLALSQPEFAAAVRARAARAARPARARREPAPARPPAARRAGRRRRAGALIEEAVGGLRPAAARRAARARARSHLPAPGADPGGGGRAARAAVQHLPRPPHARRRARRRPALAARAVRPAEQAQLGRNSPASRHRSADRCCASPTTRRWRACTDRRARCRDRRQHGRAAGRPGAGRRVRARHGARPRHAARRRRGRRAVPQGAPRALAAAARPGLPGGAAAGARRRARRGGRADVRGADGDARSCSAASGSRAPRSGACSLLAEPAVHRGPRPPPRARAARTSSCSTAATRSGSTARPTASACRRADPAARRRQRGGDAAGRPGRARDRAAARAAGVAGGARLPAAGRGARSRSTSVREPPPAAARPARSAATSWC